MEAYSKPEKIRGLRPVSFIVAHLPETIKMALTMTHIAKTEKSSTIRHTRNVRETAHARLLLGL
jgi:hypothetical protein